MYALKRIAYNTLKSWGVNPPDIVYAAQALKKKAWSMVDREIDRVNPMVNIGGVRFYKRHWKVLDYRHPDTRHYDFPGLDYNFDLASGLPFPFESESVSFFYSSHTLEHIVPSCAQHILNEIFRCLKPGGATRLTMPDYDCLYDAFMREDWRTVVNIAGSPTHDLYRAFVHFHGVEEARRRLRGWPDVYHEIPPPYSDEQLANAFFRDFAGHRAGTIALSELKTMVKTMTREELADKLVSDVPPEWKRLHPEQHNNWWNYNKLSGMLRKAGFSTIYRSRPFDSRFPQMVGCSKYGGFDHMRMDNGLYVEAVK